MTAIKFLERPDHKFANATCQIKLACNGLHLRSALEFIVCPAWLQMLIKERKVEYVDQVFWLTVKPQTKDAMLLLMNC